MTKHDLKELAAMGAELGAAKAENVRLRGLLHGAHDTIRNLAEDLDEEEFQATIDQLAEIELALAQQQAEPECRCTLRERTVGDGCSVCNPELSAELAADIEDDEPAPAQDERGVLLAEARMVIDACLQEVDLPSELAWMAERASKGRRIYVDERAVAIRPAQTEPQPVGRVFTDEERFRSDGKSGPVWWFGPLPAGAMLYAAPIAQTAPQGKFRMGEPVRKISGSQWKGKVVGTYSTELTPEGYCVESSAEKGSVQIYPAKALEAVE